MSIFFFIGMFMAHLRERESFTTIVKYLPSPYDFLMLSGGRERVHWEQMG